MHSENIQKVEQAINDIDDMHDILKLMSISLFKLATIEQQKSHDLYEKLRLHILPKYYTINDVYSMQHLHIVNASDINIKDSTYYFVYNSDTDTVMPNGAPSIDIAMIVCLSAKLENPQMQNAFVDFVIKMLN